MSVQRAISRKSERPGLRQKPRVVGASKKEVAQVTQPAKRIPGATYRMQFHAGFTFKQATEQLDYLRELGVTDCYASPLFSARAGSTHGYDVCSFETVNSALGSAKDFRQFCATLKQNRMGLLLDIVPNHMAADLSNSWWVDVLEQGPASRYAGFFDINWNPSNSVVQNKLLLPVLGDHFGNVLTKGELKLSFAEGAFIIDYFDKKFPVSLEGYRFLLVEISELLRIRSQNCAANIQAVNQNLEKLPSFSDNSGVMADLKRRIAEAFRSHDDFAKAVEIVVKRFNGEKERIESFEKLHQLLRLQHYHLAFWRVGPEEINYRRFFDIAELVSIRMENPRVFEATHRLVFDLLKEKIVTGLRVDHPDGMWDPKGYFSGLQEKFSELCGKTASEKPLYVVAEKILSRGEELPDDWLVDGTTGYDFLNQLNGLFVATDNVGKMDRIYCDVTQQNADFETTVYRGKKKVLEYLLPAEVNALAHRLKILAESALDRRDFTLGQLRSALVEIIANFPVYRTYVTEGTGDLSPAEKRQVEEAILAAHKRTPEIPKAVTDFIRDLLLLSGENDGAEQEKQKRTFVMRFQQLTGPATAKGIEDTAFYNFYRLVSLNEVGGDPDTFGNSVENFHRQNSERQKSWPHSLLATATHDTKRGEDVRARINVLSEMPEEWGEAVQRWQRLNSAKKTVINGEAAPDANDEYLFYQTLIGAWPWEGANQEFRDRVAAYMLKAIKEAKAHTNWIDPNPAYEEAVQKFVEAVLSDRSFLNEFQPLQKKVAFFGRLNSLSQTLLKLTSPGVPDLYQGCELWDLSLVDPDNRRPVDYALRREMLKRVAAAGDRVGLATRLLKEAEDGKVKLFTLHAALAFRNKHQELFKQSSYLPLTVQGRKAPHLCAFARRFEDEEVIVVAPRLFFTLTQGREQLPRGRIWEDTSITLPEHASGKRYRNLFTGEEISGRKGNGHFALRAENVFSKFPIALLEPINEMDSRGVD